MHSRRWPVLWCAVVAGFIVTPALLAALFADVPTYPDKAKLLVVRDGTGQETAIKDAAGWARRRAHILAHMQEVMGPLPAENSKVPFDVRVEEEKEEGEHIRKKLTFAVEKGDRLPVYLLLPRKVQWRLPGIVCLHPTSREFGKGIPVGLGGKPDRHYALHLVERGYVCVVPDYLNMGEYRFDPYKAGYVSATMKGIWNHMRCVDLLRSLPEVDPDRIGAIGHSLGGHNAMFLGVFDERVRCVVSSCGFCSFPTYYKGDLAGWSHDGYMPRIRTEYGLKPERVPFDFPEVVGALAPRPFLACAPVKDHNFDMQGVKDCLAAAGPVYELLGAKDKLSGVYPDSGHDFPDDARKAAYAWLDRWLKPQ
jgi:hypothetical protein